MARSRAAPEPDDVARVISGSGAVQPRNSVLELLHDKASGIGLVRLDNDITLDLIEAWAIHLDAFEGSFVVGDKGGVRLNPFGFFRSVGHMDMNATTNAADTANTTNTY